MILDPGLLCWCSDQHRVRVPGHHQGFGLECAPATGICQKAADGFVFRPWTGHQEGLKISILPVSQGLSLWTFHLLWGHECFTTPECFFTLPCVSRLDVCSFWNVPFSVSVLIPFICRSFPSSSPYVSVLLLVFIMITYMNLLHYCVQINHLKTTSVCILVFKMPSERILKPDWIQNKPSKAF